MKLKLVAAAVAFVASGSVLAQARTSAPEPEYSYTLNGGVVTDYRYRGISQTRFRPAIQGGADFSHKSGFYVGTWASSIRWINDAGGDTDSEIDIYGGYKFNAGPVAVDLGVLRYIFPGSALPVGPNTTEIYVGGTYGPATLKYSHSTTNLFGFANSEGSGYLDLSATFETGFYGLTVTPHVGHQRVKNNGYSSYTDWSIGLGKDFGNGFTASLAYVDTNAKTGPNAYSSPSGRNLGRSGLVLGVKYGF